MLLIKFIELLYNIFRLSGCYQVQRVWKAHRLMLFKRFAHARGQHALVFIANMKFSSARSRHTSAVLIQRRTRVFLALTTRKRTLANIARQLMLNNAAIKVQAFVRCHMVRRSYAAERTQGLAYAKLMTILGWEGEDVEGEMVLFHYQMDILKSEGDKAVQ
mmetsp:Transcript_22181/g.37561  ORF Transcript_22181/g.37561 Transcript_22181/m.37561 type:complete len:161 (-) Transcript_22181:275-757(-)